MQAKGRVEKPIIEGLDYVGTGLVELAKSRLGGVPVLTSRRTATRAVPTPTSPC